jgi:hypothetical protein
MKLLSLLSEKINKEKCLTLLTREMDYNKEDAKEVLDGIISNVKNLPEEIKLYRLIKVDDRKDINTEEPGSHYSLNKKDLMSSHSFADGHGDQIYLITVLSPKKLVDVEETIHNNILYPHENEVTLKNKGRGVKIISIRKTKD